MTNQPLTNCASNSQHVREQELSSLTLKGERTMMIDYTNDVDLEIVQLVNDLAELADETCHACGEAYQSITLLTGVRDGQHVEEYKCICGHVSRWVNHRRLS